MALTRSSTFSTVLGTFATAAGILGIVVVRDAVSLLSFLAGLSLLTGVVAVPFIWWAIHQRRDLMLAPVDVVADGTGISLTSATSTARHDWSVFRRVRETSGAFLFDTGASAAILLSKQGIPPVDLERLRLLLVRAGTLDYPADDEWTRRVLGVVIGLAATALVAGLPIVLGA